MTESVQVVVVTCAGCGASVRHEGAVATRCQACGKVVPLPAAIRGAEAVLEEHAALEREAEGLAERIGAPPSPLVRALTAFESSCAFVITFPFVLIGGLALAYYVTTHLAERWGVPPDDRWQTIGGTGLAIAFWVGGLLAATYAGRKAAGLRDLAAGLAARVPERPGGPATCRHCGADLEVAPGAKGAICRYCRTENLVAVDRTWLRLARAAKQERGARLADAWAAHEDEEKALARSFRVRAIGSAIVGGGFFAFFAALVGSAPPSVPPTAEERLAKDSEVPRLVIERSFVGRESDAPFAPLLARSPCASANHGTRSFQFTAQGCSPGEHCMAPWYVGLRGGDTVRLETTDEGGLVLFYPRLDEPPFREKGQNGELIARARLTPAAPVELRAPKDGYYLILYSVNGADTARRFDLCAELERR